ncbi:MAG: efflux RND transporter periplasmic adaptor subunit [Betaproteobacteria bacterium]|nr:efflux RND transporter periplasmic adaptor subunit [Betaproteobacteria bacterium]
MLGNKRKVALGAVAATVLIVLLGIGVARTEEGRHAEATIKIPAVEPNTVTVTPSQAQSLKVESVSFKEFADEREAVGYIDFNQERSVPVYSPWAGRINDIRVKAGDNVKKGEPLFTVDSPDLVQAESNLISTAGVLQLTDKALVRARQLAEFQGASQRDLDQALADQQTAEANYRAARNAVRQFGKSDAEMDKIVASRKTDGLLVITSAIAGRVIARNAAPGLLVQPGTVPAPVTVADVASMWMVANVSEYQLSRLRLGARVAVTLAAYPGRQFEGHIANIGATVDPATHTVAVRSEIPDPKHELLPQMLATFVIRMGEPIRSPALPLSGVVREGDGTMTAFVTKDGLHFERRAVTTGVVQNGQQQILAGLTPGEKAATDGALFLSNALALSVR